MARGEQDAGVEAWLIQITGTVERQGDGLAIGQVNQSGRKRRFPTFFPPMHAPPLTTLLCGCLAGWVTLVAGPGIGLGQTPAAPASPVSVSLGDSGLSLTLPTGWRRTDRQPEHAETLGAFQSADSTASAFVSVAKAPAQADMTQIMQGVLANFETAFITRRLGDIKTGTLADSPAAFATLEADLRSATGPDRLPFHFYLAVIDTGRGLYLFQDSIQAPVSQAREAEMMSLLRSLAKR